MSHAVHEGHGTFGIAEGAGELHAVRLANALGERHCLLVLDNFERVVDAASEIASLLMACPRLQVLATSREALRIGGRARFGHAADPTRRRDEPECAQPDSSRAGNPATARRGPVRPRDRRLPLDEPAHGHSSRKRHLHQTERAESNRRRHQRAPALHHLNARIGHFTHSPAIGDLSDFADVAAAKQAQDEPVLHSRDVGHGQPHDGQPPCDRLRLFGNAYAMQTGHQTSHLSGHSSFSAVDLGDRTAESVAAMTRHAQILADAQRDQLVGHLSDQRVMPTGTIRRFLGRLFTRHQTGRNRSRRDLHGVAVG